MTPNQAPATSPDDATPLSPTARTSVTRGRNRAVADRSALWSLLDEALVCHLAVDAGEHPVVLPTAFGVDPDGPDAGGTLYLHGSVAAGWVRRAPETVVCVGVTVLDGLVTARSTFHHSMNYRSAVVIGRLRVVEDPAEKERALALIVDHMVPGRTATLRPSTRKELAATAVVALPLHEASVKARAGGPADDAEDVAAGVWGGHVPLRLVADPPVTAPDATGPVPEDVGSRASALGAR